MGYIVNWLNKVKGKNNYEKAQKYELDSARIWVEKNFESLFYRIEDAKKHSEKWPGPENLFVEEFFSGNIDNWYKFMDEVSKKSALDIGCGPCSVLCLWYWIQKKIIIDPLANEYKKLSMDMFGRTWFSEDIIMYSKMAEHRIERLINSVDGFIVCRNALDHCQNPEKIIENMAAYAVKGCHLFLWTDLYHFNGLDQGHFNITRSIEKFQKILIRSGFNILNSRDDIRDDRSTINYGCVAIKR